MSIIGGKPFVEGKFYTTITHKYVVGPAAISLTVVLVLLLIALGHVKGNAEVSKFATWAMVLLGITVGCVVVAGLAVSNLNRLSKIPGTIALARALRKSEPKESRALLTLRRRGAKSPKQEKLLVALEAEFAAKKSAYNAMMDVESIEETEHIAQQ